MALTYQSIGTVGVSAANGTTLDPSYPASIAAGDNLILIVLTKPTAAGNNATTVSTPGGWTLIGASAYEGGYGTEVLADTGNTKWWAYSKDTVSGSESGTLTVTVATNPSVCAAYIIRVTDDGGTISYGFASGGDGASGTPMSVTCGSNPGIEAGDFLIAALGEPTDVGTVNARFSSQTIAATSATIGTVSERADDETSNGLDLAWTVFTAACTAGTASAAPVITAAISGTNTNSRGPGIVIRIRESAIVHSASASFSGESSFTATGVVTKVASAAFSGASNLGGGLSDPNATEVENYQYGTNGSAIGTSYGIFDGGVNGATSTSEHSNAHPVNAINGPLGWHIHGVGGEITYRDIIFSGSNQLLVHYRDYIYITEVDVAGANLVLVEAWNTAGTTRGARFSIVAITEFIRMQNNATGVGTGFDFTPLYDQMVRLEWKLDHANSLQTLRLFYGGNLHGTTPDLEEATTYTSGSGTAFFRIGQVTAPDPDIDQYRGATAWRLADWVGPLVPGGPAAVVTPAGGGPETHDAAASFSGESAMTATGSVVRAPGYFGVQM